MGTKGRAIVGLDVDHLLTVLNQAYADEWLAYYQYWLGAKIIKGPMKDAVAAELTVHATEELNHAVLVADRIIDGRADRALASFARTARQRHGRSCHLRDRAGLLSGGDFRSANRPEACSGIELWLCRSASRRSRARAIWCSRSAPETSRASAPGCSRGSERPLRRTRAHDRERPPR